MRLIDADELEKRFNEECSGDCGMCKHETFNNGVYSCKLITDAPTVPLPDFKEGYKQAIRDGKTNFSRPQGEWEMDNDNIPVCKNCGEVALQRVYVRLPQFIEEVRMVKSHFCPNCGADMKQEAEE